MKQTAMQEAINHLNIWLDSGLSFDKWIENYKDKYIEVEKEQIMNAWYNGFEENRPYVDHSEDYYNETFNK